MVKKIFSFCADGKTPQQVADILESKKVLSPLAVKGTSVKIKNPYGWNASGIINILRNTAYIGYWYKTVKGEKIIQRNEPLVTEQVFHQAQGAIRKRPLRGKTKREDQPYPFASLVADADTGLCLSHRVDVDNGKEYFAYSRKRDKNPECKKSRICYSEIEHYVRTALDDEHKKAEYALSYLKEEGAERKEELINELRTELLTQSVKLAEAQKAYMENANGRDEKETSAKQDKFSETYQQLARENEDMFAQAKKQLAQINRIYSEDNPWLKRYLTYDCEAVFTNERLKFYIEKVYVSKLEAIKVKMKEENFREMLLGGMEE